MTKAQVRRAAQSIFEMRLNRVGRPSRTDLNTRRIAIKKRLEDRRFNSLLAALQNEVAA